MLSVFLLLLLLLLFGVFLLLLLLFGVWRLMFVVSFPRVEQSCQCSNNYVSTHSGRASLSRKEVLGRDVVNQCLAFDVCSVFVRGKESHQVCNRTG